MVGLLIVIICMVFIILIAAGYGGEEMTYTGQQYKSEYDRLLHEPQWYEFRQKIIKQHGNKCDWCGTRYRLQVHHKYYLKTPDNKHVEPWDYPDNAMMCLCEDCHKKAHEKYKIRTYYIKYRRWWQ